MQRQTHYIEKQVLNIHMKDMNYVDDVLQATQSLVQHRVLPSVGELFDRLISPSQILQLERVEVSIFIDKQEGWEIALEKGIINALELLISRSQTKINTDSKLLDNSTNRLNENYGYNPIVKNPDITTDEWINFKNQEDSISGSGSGPYISASNLFDYEILHIGDIQKKSISKALAMGFLQFLESGVWDKFLFPNDGDTASGEFSVYPREDSFIGLEKRLLESLDQNYAPIREFIGVLTSSINALQRLAYQFSLDFIQKFESILKKRYSSLWYKKAEMTSKFLESFEKHSIVSPNHESIAIKSVIPIAVLIRSDNRHLKKYFDQYLNHVGLTSSTMKDGLCALFFEQIEQGSPTEAFNLVRQIDAIINNIAFNSDKSSLKKINEKIVGIDKTTFISKNIIESEGLTEGIRKPELEIPYYYISNAGVILLHPFLQPFFNHLGLIDGSGYFITNEHAGKAAHWLHFLATGVESDWEFNLVFPKILCGLELNTPIPKHIKLHSEGLEEADKLIKAAIYHWSALGKTSPDALRQSFLQRAGKVEIMPNSFHLQIESSGVDVLLEKLPWSISMIQLPWLAKIIHTEWSLQNSMK